MFRRGYTGPPAQIRNLPESDDRPHASADPPHAQRTPLLDIMRFVPVPTNLVAAATAPQRSRYRHARASRQWQRIRRIGARRRQDTRIGHSPLRTPHPKRSPSPVPSRSRRDAHQPQRRYIFMTLHAEPTSVLPTSIAVSTTVQYGQPLTGNYSIEITTAKAALAERLLTILVSAA